MNKANKKHTNIRVTTETRDFLKEYKETYGFHSIDTAIRHLLVNAKIHVVKTIAVAPLNIAEKKTFEIKLEGDKQ